MSTDSVGSKGSIWDALNTWGTSLPGWQRFIVSFAVRDGKLSDERVTEAYSHYLRAVKLSDDTAPLPAIPVSTTGRPDSTDTSSFLITGIRNPVNVNAIPNTSELLFGSNLTIIYGRNGAGKSGFARILSAACFSRSDQKILPNVYNKPTSALSASADISIRRGQNNDEVFSFAEGSEHAVLRRISVFDSAIARVHLAEETPLGFQPAGFDVFDEVSRVIGIISERLDGDISKRRAENKFANIFIGESAIKTEIVKLSKDTDLSILRTLAIYGETEISRLAVVDTEITDLKTKSPTELIRQRETAKKDTEEVRKQVLEFQQKLGFDACTKLGERIRDLKAKIAAAITLSLGSIGDPSLTNTGSQAWEIFAKSARQLAILERETYPNVGDPCLLCHRPLDEPSVSLVRRFWSFLDDEARVAAEKANAALNTEVEQFKKINITLLPGDGRIRSDLQKITPSFVASIDAFVVTLATRRDQIIAFLESTVSSLPDVDLVVPTETIDANILLLDSEIAQLRANAVDKALASREAEHILLRHRQVLSQNIDDICTYVENLRWIDKATTLKRSLTTRFATDKQKELFQRLIEGSYKDKLKEECSILDAVLPVEFKARGSGGRTLRGLQMESGHKPNDVLSEGEQRAVALADFLTEVNLNPSGAAIILDDPVTSLDHIRKLKIANRLSSEAKVRQVIVFTHDLVFFSALMDAANDEKIETSTHWVDRDADGTPGCVSLDDSPANSEAYKTTHRAREALAKAKKSQGQSRVDLVCRGASALRNTLEEVIIRDLFNGTVRRWNEQVRIGNIKNVLWSDEVADEICRLQDDISRLIDAHSTSDEFGGGMPEPDELEKLIVRVETVQTSAKKRRK